MKNQSELIRKYPEFFEYLKDHKGPIMPIQFGFECDDGWYWLISALMETIHSYCKQNKKQYPNIVQVKEKFGGLRFYYHGGDKLIDGMVWLAEHLSYKICETCGTTENVIIDTEGWIYTKCSNCRKEYIKHRKLNYIKWQIKNPGLLLRLSVKNIKRKIKLIFAFLQK